jgi:hypothetical protein
MATTTNNGWATPDDSDPFKQGASAIRTLGSAIDTSVGTGLLAWTSYTPTLTNITLGTGGTSDFHYAKLGKTVIVRGIITFGTGGGTGFTGSNTVTLPVTANADYGVGVPLGGCVFTNNSTYYTGTVLSISTTGMRLLATNTAGTLAVISETSSTSPLTWASGHKALLNITYEAA